MLVQTVGELLNDRVTLDLEGIDRLYLNLYQPRLQTGGGVANFFKVHRGAKVASTVLMAPISRAFVNAIEGFAQREGVEIVTFARGQRKDDVTRERLGDFAQAEGVLYIGKAQERFASFRMIKKISTHTGQPYPWFTRGTVMCNHFYFYLVDANFGPLFITFCSYFPYTARICLNGHEYVKRQLAKEGIAFEALDNGLLACADPARAQRILDDLNEETIAALVAKWLGRLPDPFTAEDHAAGYTFQLSILQAEFARTQVFDRPLSGRHLFEEVIRENLDLGRPEKVSLIFSRRITKRTPGSFHTRVITQGVTPSLHVSYKASKIKQYFKEPQVVGGQRAPRLHLDDPRVLALFTALCLFLTLPEGFRHARMRTWMAEALGLPLAAYSPGRMTYDLRRLRLHGLIERIPHSHSYRVTDAGLRVALFFTKVHSRILRPGLSQLFDGCPKAPNRPIATAMGRLQLALDDLFEQAKLEPT
ncbi:hypothetical protein [Thiocapsa rosea]|uniref:Uncharacterized protein n=1 Tax=Thiocapsa rosea TaxID=69360 RepID=A0A495VEZ7_9GAMM|nr:hypothetical protein [Thiocapsa rosea]RKT47015.1 hypothetical protein BDD21_4564 [Thiocapsa rosea]